MQMVDDDCPPGKRLKIEPQAHPPALNGVTDFDWKTALGGLEPVSSQPTYSQTQFTSQSYTNTQSHILQSPSVGEVQVKQPQTQSPYNTSASVTVKQESPSASMMVAPQTILHVKQEPVINQPTTTIPVTPSNSSTAASNNTPNTQPGPTSSNLVQPGQYIPNTQTHLTKPNLPSPHNTPQNSNRISQPAPLAQHYNNQPAPPPGTNSQNINQTEMKNMCEALGLTYNPTQSMNIQPVASPQIQYGSSWRDQVNSNLREHLVQKIVEAIIPKPSGQEGLELRIKVMNHPRMIYLSTYAKKVEQDMFAVAESREQYYQLLAEKIYKIRREREEKRKQRQLLQRQQQQQQQQQIRDLLQSPPAGGVQVKQPQTQSPYNTSACMTVKQESPSASMMVSPQTVLQVKQEPVMNQPTTTIPVTPSNSSTAASNNTPNTQLNTTTTTNASTSQQVDGKPVVSKPVITPENKITENRKTWSKDELKGSLHPVIELLWKMDEAIPFRQPVDPISLNIPDYFDFIKKPIDLSTIKKKLNSGNYQTPWDFINDMYLMFDNAKLYNKKTSPVHQWSVKLQKAFEGRINSVMTSLGYCCGQKFEFRATRLFCYSKSACIIAPEQPYWSHSDRYFYCEKCFNEMKSESIKICVEVGDDGSADPPADSEQEKVCLKRSEFKLLRNNIYDDRLLSIERCIAFLVHACSCRDANCSLSICEKMKKVVAHTKGCKRKQNSDCTICKQLLSLVIRHTKQCKETMCPVPFCSGIREKVRRTQALQRAQQNRFLERRMAMMAGGTVAHHTTVHTPARPVATALQRQQQQAQQQIAGQVSGQPGISGQQTQQGAGVLSKEIINQFKQAVQHPQTPQKKEQVQQLLRANPALMQLLVKAKNQRQMRHRQIQQQQQQQQQLQQQNAGALPQNLPIQNQARPVNQPTASTLIQNQPNNQLINNVQQEQSHQSAQDELSKFVENL